MARVQIFLSTVSAEFRSYRERLRRDLTRPNVSVSVQEDFIVTGTETLDMLDDYIRQCDAVIHLVGDMTGSPAQAPSLAVIRQRYPDLVERLPPLAPFLQPDAPALSYTQWEAWLALYHNKPLIIAAPEDNAPRDERHERVPDQQATQQAHLQRLAEMERYPFRFANADRLAIEVLRSKVHEILVLAEPPTRPGSSSDPDLLPLLRTVKRDWIEGVLANSLHGIVQLELGKQSYTRAIDHPLREVIELEGQNVQHLPPNTRIIDIYRKAGDFLLILGEPGAGKTVTLLELASELIATAEADSSKPVPVVLNLSTWKESDPDLTSWIIEELKSKYFVKAPLSKKWLKNSRLLLMLDGLDEVRASARANCVKAINAFLEESTPVGMVVACRFTEYQDLPIRLRFRGAIKLLPLTPDQIDDYLAAPGLNAVQTAVQADASLRELAQSPLALNIMVLAYKDDAGSDILIEKSMPRDERYKSLMNRYIEKMFRRKGEAKHLYAREQVLHGLSWLAQHLSERSQTIFLIENLQPDWLAGRAAWTAYWVGTRFLWAVIFGLAIVAADLLLKHVLDIPRESVSIVYLRFVLFVTCCAVGMGLIDGRLYSNRYTTQHGSRSTRFWFRTLLYGGTYTLIVLLCYMVEIVVPESISAMIWASIGLALLSGTASIRSIKRDAHGDIITKAFSWSWKRAEQGYIWGIVCWTIYYCAQLPSQLNTSSAVGITAACTGLIVLAAPYFWRHVRQNTSGQIPFLSKIGMTTYLAATGRLVIISLATSLTIAAGKSLSGGWTTLKIGNDVITPLGTGILFPIYCALIVASFSGIKPSAIESTATPNQGIALTLRHMAVTSMLVFLTGFFFFGPWFLHSTSGFREMATTSLFAFSYISIAVGLWYGAAVLRHYVLRYILYRQGHTPKNLASFLDYATKLIFLQKVGGGYVFIHRLVMEHFAILKENHPNFSPVPEQTTSTQYFTKK